MLSGTAVDPSRELLAAIMSSIDESSPTATYWSTKRPAANPHQDNSGLRLSALMAVIAPPTIADAIAA